MIQQLPFCVFTQRKPTAELEKTHSLCSGTCTAETRRPPERSGEWTQLTGVRRYKGIVPNRSKGGKDDWLDPGGIMLHGVSQTQKDSTASSHSCVEPENTALGARTDCRLPQARQWGSGCKLPP